MITYAAQVVFENSEDEKRVRETLAQTTAFFNYFSEKAYPIYTKQGKLRLMELHHGFYHKARKKFPNTLAQIAIRAENDVSATYSSIRSNKHKIDKAPVRRKNCLRLDKNLFNWETPRHIRMAATGGKRVLLSFKSYPKLEEYLGKHKISDPLLYEKNGKVWAMLTFQTPQSDIIPSTCVGIDVGMRFIAVTSEGNAIKGNVFNGVKRKIRHLKKRLQSSDSKSARKHLVKLKKKERNYSRNFSHHVANTLLASTSADTLVIEKLTLKQMKTKKHQKQNKSRINQLPLKELRTMLEYKAKALRKAVLTVSPSYTSQDDCRGLERGIRKGRRYYATDGIILDSDHNASLNIALKSGITLSDQSKLSLSLGPLDGLLKPVKGQGAINHPIAGSLFQTSSANPAACGAGI